MKKYGRNTQQRPRNGNANKGKGGQQNQPHTKKKGNGGQQSQPYTKTKRNDGQYNKPHTKKEWKEPTPDEIFLRIEKVSRHEQVAYKRLQNMDKGRVSIASYEMAIDIQLNNKTSVTIEKDINKQKEFKICTLYIVLKDDNPATIFYTKPNAFTDDDIAKEKLGMKNIMTRGSELVHQETEIYCLEPKDAFDTQKLPTKMIDLNRYIKVYYSDGDYYTICQYPILISTEITNRTLRNANVRTMTEEQCNHIRDDQSLVYKIKNGIVKKIHRPRDPNNKATHKDIITGILTNNERANVTELYVITESQNDLTERGFIINTGSEVMYTRCPMLRLYDITTEIENGTAVETMETDTPNLTRITNRIKMVQKAMQVSIGFDIDMENAITDEDTSENEGEIADEDDLDRENVTTSEDTGENKGEIPDEDGLYKESVTTSEDTSEGNEGESNKWEEISNKGDEDKDGQGEELNESPLAKKSSRELAALNDAFGMGLVPAPNENTESDSEASGSDAEFNDFMDEKIETEQPIDETDVNTNGPS